MISARAFTGICLAASLFSSLPPAAADTYQLILSGKVTMPDGSPPPKSISIERVCTDIQGSAPGPLTNKKGEYVWRMEVDPLAVRTCVLQAHFPGYVSSTIDISAFTSNTNPAMPPIVLSPASSDANNIVLSDKPVPPKAQAAWKAALKALDAQNLGEVARQLQAAVEAAPKFQEGWSILGIVSEKVNNLPQAKDAYQHAIDADPKQFPPYIGLTRVCLKTKDWQGAANAADALIKVDTKKTNPEIFLHQAVARYQLKDLPGAEASAQQALKLDPFRRRSEYVLGRILEAKGDLDGAREHISKYLMVEPTAPDAEKIKAHLDNLGKPGAAEPELEVL